MLHIKSFVFSPIQENTYLLYNEFSHCMVIDPGCYFPEEKEALETYISLQHLKPRMLLNTHCHLDHIFGNKFVAETYGLTLQLHENEQIPLQMAPASGLLFNLPFDNYTGSLAFLKEGERRFPKLKEIKKCLNNIAVPFSSDVLDKRLTTSKIDVSRR